MQILLSAICRAGLNKGRIRDALTGLTSYHGVTGDMAFDPIPRTCPDVSCPVHNGQIEYHTSPWRSPTLAWEKMASPIMDRQPRTKAQIACRIAVFGPHADEAVRAPECSNCSAR